MLHTICTFKIVIKLKKLKKSRNLVLLGFSYMNILKSNVPVISNHCLFTVMFSLFYLLKVHNPLKVLHKMIQ